MLLNADPVLEKLHGVDLSCYKLFLEKNYWCSATQNAASKLTANNILLL